MDSPQLLSYDDFFSAEGRVTAFSTTRHGGCSLGNHGAFNINRYCGDRPEHVDRNRELLCRRLNLPDGHIVMPHQTHSDVVTAVDIRLLALPEAARTEAIDGVDALTTDVAGICIGVSTADCIPILLYDPDHHAAAAVHAGWRGTAKRIAEKAVTAMQERYGACPDRMKAVIGPGIGIDAFEVGDEVYDQFATAGFPMDKIARRYHAGKWHINLPACNRLQLETAGVAIIQTTNICTWQHADDFFSARRLTPDCGRIFTGIILR